MGRADAGMYQCFVRGDEDTMQDAAELRLGGKYSSLVLRAESDESIHNGLI